MRTTKELFAAGAVIAGVLGSSGCKSQSSSAPTEVTATSVAALSGDGGADAGHDAGHDAGADAGTASPSIGSFAVYATESILLDANSLVTGCNVGVENTTGPFLSGNASAYLNSGAKIQSSRTLYAYTTYLNSGASLGPIDTTKILGNGGATYGTVSGFPSSMPAPPPMPSATAGSTTIQLNSGSQTITAGAYGSVLLNSGTKLTLSGGNYVFSSLTLNGAATLVVSAATTLSVTGSTNFGSGSFIGPASGSGLTAKSFVIYFDSSSNLNLNSGLQIQALVLANNAQVNVDTSEFTGALSAAQVIINSGATVTCQDGFGSLVGCPGGCNHGNPCDVGTCTNGTCTYAPVANGTACAGTNLCDQTYTCQSGTCTGSNPVVCTASDQCHTAGTCNPSTGTCSNPDAANGTTCNDGNACDLSDTCQSGVCTAGSHVTCTAEDQCHEAGTCNPSTGVCSNPTVANGTTCTGTNLCDQTNTCQSGTCTGANPVVCVASDQCHVAGTCNPSTGACSNPTATNGTTCSDGNACDLNDSCQAGVCTAGSHVACTASDSCHVAGSCNSSTGQCSNPTAPNGTSCNDGNACDLNDSCQAGVCTAGSHVTCTASDQCHAAGTCNPSTGTCSNPTVANGTTCSDGNACDLNDTCQSGVCTAGSHVTCTAEDQCHTAGTCNPSTGTCSNPTVANGTTCSDGNACDLNDTCQSGVCTAGSHVTCTASDQCHTAGTCNPSTGTCSNPDAANGTTCSDGNACDLNDMCQSGVCTAGSHVTCTASDQCHTAGTCNPSTGTCSNPDAANGTTCNDGNACDLNDTCQSGVCTAGSHVTCAASDQCHVAGTCDPTSGTCSNPDAANGTTCTGTNPCFQSYACSSGTCTGANHVTCTASDQCHVAGTCDPTSGTCSNPTAPNGSTCNDGNACTQSDACQSGTCTGSNPVVCGAPQPQLVATAPLTTGVSEQAAAALTTGDVLVTGGTPDAESTALTTAAIFHAATGTWTAAASMNAARYGHTATLLPDGRVLVAGGKTNGGETLKSAEIYDPTQGTWTSVSSMFGARYGNQATLLRAGQVLVVGATSVFSPYAETYNPTTGAWSVAAAKGPPPPGVGAGELLSPLADGRVLVAGGQSIGLIGGPTGASIFDPTTGIWTAVTSMPAPRTQGCGGLLPDGTVIFAGGTGVSADAGTPVSLGDAIIYGPATDTWSPAGSMSVARAQGACAVLPNGVLVVDGGGAPGADLYNLATGHWSSLSSSTSRTLQTATLTGAGRVLAAGGLDTGGNTLSSADLISSVDATCTQSSCNPQNGQCSTTNVPTGTSCNDGDACLQSQSCTAGYCVGSNPTVCPSTGPCQAGVCDPQTGACGSASLPNGTTCNDGNQCTQNEMCTAGACTGTPVTCAPIDQCHVAGSCDPSSGVCSNPAAPDGTSCNDGNPCDTNDTCQAGVCTAGSHVTCAASDACHVAGTCDPTTGTCSNPVATNGTACNDGNPCDTNDTCQAGVCTAGGQVQCTASDACHVAGSCDPSTGQCSKPNAANGTSCNDGNACDLNDTCQSGVCTAGSQVTCTASDACHVAGTCNPATGTCSNPPASDGTTCTGTNPCFQTYACSSGTCTGTNPVTCTASDQCHTAGTCNPSTGTCSNPIATNGTTCNDGNACTQGETCQGGACSGGSAVTCPPPSGQCQVAAACNPQTGCASAPAADGSACTGTDLCNQTYECSAGACVGSNPVNCTASDQCHVAGSCNPTTGGCSNPAAANGSTCNDGNACTQFDACQNGACTGSDPVTCTPSDACHLAGACNPSTGSCSNPSAPNGTTCGTSGDGGASQVCDNGACVTSQSSCPAYQTSCSGICTNTQNDPTNCGACGNACQSKYSCVAGNCVSPQLMANCGLPTGSMSVLVAADGVTAYVPNGGWSGSVTGIQRLVIEGGSASSVTIPTPDIVNSCASNWVTGQTVCTTQSQKVYTLSGSSITSTIPTAWTTQEAFSGGFCYNCGVAIDPFANQAVLEVGLTASGRSMGGYSFMDLATNALGTPVAAGVFAGAGSGYWTSENVAVDPIRHLVLSPNEVSNYQIVQYGGASPAVFNNTTFPPIIPNGNTPEFDSAAEDCTTGIAVATNENVTTYVGASAQLVLVDLSQATFTSGSPSGTWTAPFSAPILSGLPGAAGTEQSLEMTGVSVAPGSHLGLITNEYGGGTIVVFQLPSTSGTGTPQLVDWAALQILNDPSGAGWGSGGDPHTVTAYVSPRTGRATGVIANMGEAGLYPPTFVATLDLQCVLSAPRQAGSHNVATGFDLAANGCLDFTSMPCSGVDIYTDPANCNGCGKACGIEANSVPVCNLGNCQLVCNQGTANCDNNYNTGCEAVLASDPNNCGACGHSCAAPNATGVCSASQCGLQCNPGYSNCDGNDANGCETQGSCEPLSVALSGPPTAVCGTPSSYTASVTEPVPGRTLQYAWTQASGPGTVTFSAADELTTNATFDLPGSYVLQFEVTDGFGNAVGDFPVTASFVNMPPVVTVGPPQTLNSPTLTTTLTGSATDDGLPLGATLSSTWSLLSGPDVAVSIASPTVTGIAEPGPLNTSTVVTFAYPGVYTFQLAVSDTDLTGYGTVTVNVNPPAAPVSGGSSSGGGTTAPPTVSIGGVTDDQEVTQATAILGNVSDGAWILQYRYGGRDDTSGAFTILATGTGAVNGTKIATFDPTLLLNGIYTLQLSSENSAGSSTASVSLSVDGRMKIGNFTLTFTDLSTSVGNLPLTVTRTYDSRVKTVGDFGVGWKLGITDVNVTKSGKTGAYWTQQFTDFGVVGQYCLVPTQASSVAITFPSGRQYRFTPQANLGSGGSPPNCVFGSPDNAPDNINWVSTSDPNNPTIQLTAANSASLFAVDVGNGVTQLQESGGDIWDPRQFTLTIEDGSIWLVDQDLGVTQVTDRTGNYIKITPGGILHSSGTQVTFARDDLNRITTITDPNGKSMSYAYTPTGDLASFTDRASNVTQFSYDDSHYLLQIQDPLGRLPVRNTYDDSGRLLSTTDATGNTVHYTPNLADNQEQVTDRLGHVTLYTYNQSGDITQKVDATGAVWNYTVDLRGNVTSTTDPNGHTKSTTYDGADDPLTQTDALGRVTTSAYNLIRELVTTTDPLGRMTTNTYDGGTGTLIATSDPLGNTTHYTYDSNGNRLSQTDALGATTYYQYDAANNVIQETDPLGNLTTHTYDSNGNKLQDQFVRSQTVTTRYTYDSLGRLLSTVTSAPGTGTSSSTTYTATGKRATSTDGDGRVTSYAYDALDRLITTTRPDGTTTSQTYDAENHRITSTDAAGNTTSYAYDGVGRLTRTTYADGSSTSTAYDGAGNAIQTADELGHVTWTAYDATGRRISTTNAVGALTQYFYDAAGNQQTVIDPLGHPTSFTYDADNRVVATTYADGSSDSTLYDPTGRVAAKTDTLGRSTHFTYDAKGQLVKVTDALGDITQYTYDQTGDKTSQEDANRHATSYVYDYATVVMTQRFLPDGSEESFADDAAGQILTRQDYKGQVTHYAYDPMGRVLSRSYPDGTSVVFTYTPTGQRATAVDSRGTTSYAYDARNRLTLLTYPDGRQIAYGYDAHGNRTRLTAKIGSSSLTTTTAYDADNRPTTVTDPLGRSYAASYDADDAPAQMQYPNGIETTYGYDVRHRLTDISTVDIATSAPIASFGYTLDTEGERTQVLEADGTVRQYGYDSISRLTSETVTGSLTYAKQFAYDGVGNRQTQVTTGSGAASVTYAYDSRDRLTTENSTAYTYDANGNVISKAGEAGYGWDFDNRLSYVTLASGALVSHQYDADGNRVQTKVAAAPSGAVACASPAGTFLREDTTTQGNWLGVYGSDGEAINAETPTLPSYAGLTFTSASSFTWSTNTTSPHALELPPPSTARIASTWYSSTSMTMHVTVGDGNAHTVALYLLDWNGENITETITAQTPGGVVLDAARPYGGFTQGVWAVYQVCGDVDFVFTRTGTGGNAVVAGVFFGAPVGAASVDNLLVDTAGCPSCGGGGALSQNVAETDGNGNLTALYVRNRDQLLAVMRPGSTPGTWTTRFIHGDGLGSIRALTDETGTTIDARAYEAFGTKNVEAGSDTLTYGFAGEPFQSDSMLAYHRARWMDARVGRFEGMDLDDGDPFEPFSLHRYLYGGDAPTDFTDPTGDDFGSFDIGIVSDFSLRLVYAQFVALASISVQGSFVNLPDGPPRSGPGPGGHDGNTVTRTKLTSTFNPVGRTMTVVVIPVSLQTSYYNGRTRASPNAGGPNSVGATLGQHEDAHKQLSRDWYTDLRVKGLAAAANISFAGIINPHNQLQAIQSYLHGVVDCLQKEGVDGIASPAGCPATFTGQ